MAKTWKDMLKVKQQRIKERDWIAKDLGTPKYRQRVISNKRTKDAEAKMLEKQYWDVEGEAFTGGWD